MKSDIISKIALRKDQVAVILKRYKIKMTPSAEAVEVGYRKYGNRFALDIAQVFQEAPAVKVNGGFLVSNSTLAGADTPVATEGSGNVWDFLGGLFNTAGDAYSEYLNKKYGDIIENPGGTQQAQSSAMNSTTLIMIGLGLVIFILIMVLIIKR